MAQMPNVALYTPRTRPFLLNTHEGKKQDMSVKKIPLYAEACNTFHKDEVKEGRTESQVICCPTRAKTLQSANRFSVGYMESDVRAWDGPQQKE